MNKKELIDQVYSLSVAGYFNREKFTKKRFSDYVTAMLKGSRKSFVVEIALPDGWWFLEITYYGKGFYLYYLPDTREQEINLISSYFPPTFVLDRLSRYKA